jgi:hypothetical protein
MKHVLYEMIYAKGFATTQTCFYVTNVPIELIK